MLSRKALTVATAVALLAAFTAGVVHLFNLRFQSGDIYPAYSSLRADPLGGKAFHDSLDALPGVESSRHFRSLKRLEAREPFTLFYTGVPLRAAWAATEVEDFQKLLKSGMRLVMTFEPVVEKPYDGWRKAETSEEERDKAEKRANESQRTEKYKEPEEKAEPKILSMAQFVERWGFTLNYLKVPTDDAAAVVALAAIRREGKTEPKIPWRTLTFFDKLQPGWRVLYECKGKPVIIEKAFDSGSIVFCSDTYFLSNEALRHARTPALLAFLTGGNRRIVFDELHHGIADKPGVMLLARKYRLHAFIASLLVLAVLFVWQNAVPLVPAHADRQTSADVVLGKDSSAGFVNLLRRNVPPKDLLGVCWQAWHQAFSHQGTRTSHENLTRAEAIVSASQQNQGRDVLTAYRELSQLLTRRKKQS